MLESKQTNKQNPKVHTTDDAQLSSAQRIRFAAENKHWRNDKINMEWHYLVANFQHLEATRAVLSFRSCLLLKNDQDNSHRSRRENREDVHGLRLAISACGHN